MHVTSPWVHYVSANKVLPSGSVTVVETDFCRRWWAYKVFWLTVWEVVGKLIPGTWQETARGTCSMGVLGESVIKHFSLVLIVS